MSDFLNKYPYTDFHELNLDWVIARVKKLTEDWLATHEEWLGVQQDWADTEQAWIDFKAYVENYLANLDVQDEIDNKINEMILNGTFETIIRPTVISQTTAATEAWLAAHITQPTTPAIDNTLTIAGAAADAKAAGDAIDLATQYRGDASGVTSYDALTDIGWYAVTYAQSSSITDKPTGTHEGVLINLDKVGGTGNVIGQWFVGAFTGEMYYRLLVNGVPYMPWIKYAMQDQLDNAVQLKSVSEATYSNMLGKISTPMFFAYGVGSTWTDKPSAASDGIFINFALGNNYALQMIIRTSTPFKIFKRVVNYSTYTSIDNWVSEIDGAINSLKDISLHYEQVNAADYNNQLAKVNKSICFGFTYSSTWTDKPCNDGILIIMRFISNYLIQICFNLANLNLYVRVVDNSGGIYIDWMLKQPEHGKAYYAIGDSITSGSYSENGQGYPVSNAEWSYPRRLGTEFGFTVHNLAVPGNKLADMITQAGSVGSDANLVTISGGTNDYLNDTPLGDISDAGSSTVYGALKTIVETVAANAPNARIVLISPFIIKYGTLATKWSLNYNHGSFDYEGLNTAFKDVAEYYNLDFLDGTHHGPTNILNIDDVQEDGIHPTKAFYSTIETFISQIF